MTDAPPEVWCSAVRFAKGIKMDKEGYVYIMSNWTGRVLYVGVTSHLKQRVYQHRQKLVDGFSKTYNLSRLVFFQICPDIRSAILREKQLKAGSRQKKVEAIERMNPNWEDLYSKI